MTTRDISPTAFKSDSTRDVPALHLELIAALREDLQRAQWSSDTLEHMLSPLAARALQREQTVPALSELQGDVRPAATLTRIFMLGVEEPREALEAALPTVQVCGAQQLGLIEESSTHDGLWKACLDLRPYGARIVDPDALEGETMQASWWIASDIPAARAGTPARKDHVVGVGGASTSLRDMTLRERVDAALDMGCGCGIQAMHLTTHARRVVATDISARACAFTRFNAALNAMNIDVREGFLFDPVRGESFDLIVTNPPFVITPDSLRGSGLFEYRDDGLPRDEVVRTIVAQGPTHLVPGGVLQLIANWEVPSDKDPDSQWHLRLRQWFEGQGVDAWVVQRDVLDVAQYSEMWLRDANPNAPIDAESYRAWLADFAASQVGHVGMGFMAIRRHVAGETRPVVHCELALSGARPRGIDVRRILDTLHLPEDLREVTCLRSEDVTEERHYVPGAPDPQILILHQGGGLGRSILVGSATSALVGACDGELSIGQIVAAIALLTQRTPAEVYEEVDGPVRELLRAGMLQILKS